MVAGGDSDCAKPPSRQVESASSRTHVCACAYGRGRRAGPAPATQRSLRAQPLLAIGFTGERRCTLSFDFTKQSGLNVGQLRLLTIKNENGQTIGKCAGPSANYEDYAEFIKEVGARENVTAKLLCLDDLIEMALGEYDARAIKLMKWIPSAKDCILDRFHVMIHRVNETFNNHSDLYFEAMVVKQRDIVCSRDDPGLEWKSPSCHQAEPTCVHRGVLPVTLPALAG